jgi:hypothetical protein
MAAILVVENCRGVTTVLALPPLNRGVNVDVGEEDLLPEDARI